MNAHPQFAEALALYAMGALDNPQDLAALEAHLGTCGDCRRELEALRADTALLALSATGPQPPARSRHRLLNAIAAEPRVERRNPQRYAVGRLRRRWVTIAPVMMMAMLAVFSILLWRDLRNTRRALRHTQAQLEQVQSDLARTNKDLAEAKMIRDLHARARRMAADFGQPKNAAAAADQDCVFQTAGRIAAHGQQSHSAAGKQDLPGLVAPSQRRSAHVCRMVQAR